MALMVYGLIESEVRKAIARRTIAGLLPEGRSARPTAPNIFGTFARLGFQRVRTADGLREIRHPLTPAQQQILSAIGAKSVLPLER
ncbi:MAG: hypothetical protein ACRDHM_10730 [Actinomycetota bacterium]